MDTILNQSFVIHNKEFTRYAPHQKPSIIDHVISNCPHLIDPIDTKVTCISDHCSLTFNVRAKPENLSPRFRYQRNLANLSAENLIREVEMSQKLQTIYQYSDPNLVAPIIRDELDRIINLLAPKKRVQVRSKKNHIDPEFKEQKKEVDKLLTLAIKSKLRDDWIVFKHARNLLFKSLRLREQQYIELNINHPNKGWSFVQDYTGISKATSHVKLSIKVI